MLPHIVAFFQPCSFGLAISVFACRVLFVLIYSVPARTIHPRFVLAHSVQHYSVRSLSRLQIQFSYQFLLRSFLSSIFPSVSVSLPLWPPLYDFLSSVQASRSLLLCISVQSMPQGHQVRFFPFSPSPRSPQSDFRCSDPASRVPQSYFLFCLCLSAFSVRFTLFRPCFAVPSVLFPLLFLPHGLFSSILPVSLCLSALLPVLFPVPSRSHARSGLASVQHCR